MNIFEMFEVNKKSSVAEAWSKKYKSSINCSHPKGFSQKAHCAGKKKQDESVAMEMVCESCGMCETHGNVTEIKKGQKDSNGVTKCWPGKHAEGTKKGRNGGQVRNCVPNEGVAEAKHQPRWEVEQRTAGHHSAFYIVRGHSKPREVWKDSRGMSDFRSRAAAEAKAAELNQSGVAEANFNPSRRGFLKKAGAAAVATAMPRGLAGAAMKAVAPAVTGVLADKELHNLAVSSLGGMSGKDLARAVLKGGGGEVSANQAAYMKKLADEWGLDLTDPTDQEEFELSMSDRVHDDYLERVADASGSRMAGSDYGIDDDYFDKDGKWRGNVSWDADDEGGDSSDNYVPGSTNAAGLARKFGDWVNGDDTGPMDQLPTKTNSALPAPTTNPGMQIPKQKSKAYAQQKDDEELAENWGEPLTGWHVVYARTGNKVSGTPNFDSRDSAQKYLMTKMSANHHNYRVADADNLGTSAPTPMGGYLEETDNDDHGYMPTNLKLGAYRDDLNPRDYTPYPDEFKSNEHLRDIVYDMVEKGVKPKLVVVSPRRLTATQDWLADDRYRDDGSVFEEYADHPVVLTLDGEAYILDGHHRCSGALTANRNIKVYVFGSLVGVAEGEPIQELSSDALDRYKVKAKKSADDLTSLGKYRQANDRTMNVMKATGKQIDNTVTNIRKALNRESTNQGMAEDAEQLNVGDDVIITGDVQFNGATGVIDSFGRDNRFVVVNLYNHGRHSFHSSDVSYNDYADSDDEQARMYDAGEFRGHTDDDIMESRLQQMRAAGYDIL